MRLLRSAARGWSRFGDMVVAVLFTFRVGVIIEVRSKHHVLWGGFAESVERGVAPISRGIVWCWRIICK